jgi:iron complex transport system substrate-binding protein
MIQKYRQILFLCLLSAVCFLICFGYRVNWAVPGSLGASFDHKESRAALPPARSKEFPMTVVDRLGRKVTLQRAPERIVSLAPRITELLFAIGAGDQVVAVTSYCNYPPEAQKRQQIGGFSSESQSLEQIVALRPDLAVATGDLQWPIISELERLGVPIVSLGAESLADLYRELDLLGRLTGHSSEAARLTQAMQRRVERVATMARTIQPQQRVTVFYHVWSEPLMTVGPGSFVGELIAICGGINIVSDASQPYPNISQEVLLARDPEVILANSSAHDPMTIERLRTSPGWSSLRAVRNNRIYLIDGDLILRCGPRLVDALEIMARALYGDRFKALADRSPHAGTSREEPKP